MGWRCYSSNIKFAPTPDGGRRLALTSQAGAGLTNGRVYCKAEDPNDVVILFDVSDMAKARAWAGGTDLKAAMQKRRCRR
jgi:hypothetical protein